MSDAVTQQGVAGCLGIDHERFTYRFQGRVYRLTDIHGRLVKQILT